MKSEKIFSFFLLLAALVFCISCGGKGSKYDDLDDYDAVDTEDKDTPAPVTDEDTDENGDTEPDDSDSESDVDEDTPEIPDEINDNDKPRPDSDVDTDSDEEPVPDEDNPIEPSDTDSISHKDDPEIVCTGQTKCYDAIEEISCPTQPEENFFGQDAQYASKGYCFPKSLDSTNPQIVTDNNTGLVWQRKIPSTYEGCTGNNGALCLFSQAVNFCENLELENFNDWRLPTPEEFATIIDYGRTPAINKDIFSIPNSIVRDFWTQTAAASGSKIWYVDFTKGSTELDSDNAKLVRCVRGSNQLPGADFTIENEGNEEEIVEDSAHNLFWTKSASEEALKWKPAIDYCNNLNYNGTTGWRLPSINELASILNYSLSQPASTFPSLPSDTFWSSTSYNESPDYAWRINSSNGTIETGKKTKTAAVICVK